MEPAGAERRRRRLEGELRSARVGYGAPVKCWEIIADNLSKAGFSWSVFQRLIPTGELSGLQTRIAATESVHCARR
jgi:hypothetical protein